MPLSVYKHLGDFNAATEDQRDAIETFIYSNWPVLKGRKLIFRIAIAEEGDEFNVVV